MTANRSADPSTQPAPSQRLMRMLTGAWTSQAICAAAKLGIADHLAGGPLKADELAEAIGADRQSLFRLMRALASIDVLHVQRDGRFALGPLGECLRDNAPDSLRATAIMLGDDHHVAWGRLAESVRTGKTAFELAYGQGVFDYYNENTAAGDVFHRAMTELSRDVSQAVLDAYDFSPFNHVVDIGGGQGVLLAAILAAYPHLRGTLFDQPAALDDAKSSLAGGPLAERVELSTGDFFEEVPRGGDAYILSTVIHDWDDKKSIAILHRVREAIRDDGKLLLLERVLGPPGGRDFGTFADLNMLVMTGGKERTEDEFRQLYADAGFCLTRVVRTRLDRSVVEGVRT